MHNYYYLKHNRVYYSFKYLELTQELTFYKRREKETEGEGKRCVYGGSGSKIIVGGRLS